MQLGMIGLGRMGANMVRRLVKKGHNCVVFDRSPKTVDELVKEKATGAPRSKSWLRNSQAASYLADGSGSGCRQHYR